MFNKNTKCPIDAHCHRLCRKGVRITKDCIQFPWILDVFKNLRFHSSSALLISLGSLLTIWSFFSRLPQRWKQQQQRRKQHHYAAGEKKRIFSVMAMAMSIYRTGFQILDIRFQKSLLEMSLANRFKNLYREQHFIFCLNRFPPQKISLIEMFIAFCKDFLQSITLTFSPWTFCPQNFTPRYAHCLSFFYWPGTMDVLLVNHTS